MTQFYPIDGDKLKIMFPKMKTPYGWAEAMSELFSDYSINTPERVWMFLAQCGHETGGFTIFEENLNYSAERLIVVFKKYFPTIEAAQQYARQPQKIANKVYANRNGNGPEESGDGWRFRGRGCIQLTGKYNYIKFAKSMWKDWEIIVNNPERVSVDKITCLLTALWFWSTNQLNKLSDVGDITGVTKIINGGLNGIDHRIQLYENAKRIFT